MTTAAGIATTTVSTDQLAPLGFELTVPAASGADTNAGNGPQTWVYVFNDEVSDAFAAGHIIYRDPSVTTNDWYGGLIAPVTVHQPKVLCLGVAQHVIAAGSYGFILKQGVGLIMAGGGGLTLDTPFTTGGATTDGSALDYADGTNNENVGVIGHTATAISASVTGTAYITCG